MFNEIIVPQIGFGSKYGISVLNPDGSLVGGGSVSTTPYRMKSYIDQSDLTYNYTYFAEALTGTSEFTPLWRCFRITEDKNGNFIAKDWSGSLFNNLGDETSVKNLTYN